MNLSDLIESSRRRDEAAPGRWHVAGSTVPVYAICYEPLFREIAAVAVEAIHCEDCYPTPCNQCEACEALSKIQSLIDEAEKKPL